MAGCRVLDLSLCERSISENIYSSKHMTEVVEQGSRDRHKYSFLL